MVQWVQRINNCFTPPYLHLMIQHLRMPKFLSDYINGHYMNTHTHKHIIDTLARVHVRVSVTVQEQWAVVPATGVARRRKRKGEVSDARRWCLKQAELTLSL